jgi:hypothetical protein
MSTTTAQAIDARTRPAAQKGLSAALWLVQTLLGVLFTATGLWKLFTPLPQLATMIPWTGQVSPTFLYFIALVDLFGGVGILVPALARIKPELTVLAALGCALLQLCAIVFHVARGEAAVTPFNFVLCALALFVAWGRRYKAPVLPRA